MANYNLLKADIDEKVYQNGQQEITGVNLNSVLNEMVTTLGAEYQFAGVATTATNPDTPDAKVFYIANGKGTYTNFGGIEVTEDDVVVLYWDTAWHKEATGIASNEKLTQLGQETIYKNELNRSGKDFPIKGVVLPDGKYVENASSAYSMNKAILVKNGESLTLVGYGTTSAAAMALYGDAQLAILWKTLPYTSDDETSPQSMTFNNKTGRTINVILSTKNALKSYYFYGSCQTNEIGFEDIYHERGVCTYSSKSYMQHNRSPYTTYFIPVKAGDKLFTKVGMYNSGFRIWACNGEKQFMDSPINKRGEQAYNDKSVLTELSVIVPIGVDYIGVTNRADEHTDIMIRRSEYYANNIPSRDYRLSPQEGRVAFIIDGGYNKDAELKALFDAKGVKAGWALLYPWVVPNNNGMGVNYAQYIDWQAEGHEIDVHSGVAGVYNDIDYNVPYQPEEQKEFAAMRHKEFSDIGFIPRAFVQLGSQHGRLPTEQSRKPIYYSFEFGFTRATNTITEKDKGAVMMPSDKPWNLGRSTLEVITLEQMKGLIDECAEKKGFLCIYAHSWRIGNVQYPNQTWDTFAEMIDYAKSKCKIDTPYNCVKALYANHIE